MRATIVIAIMIRVMLLLCLIISLLLLCLIIALLLWLATVSSLMDGMTAVAFGIMWLDAGGHGCGDDNGKREGQTRPWIM